jgi:hypothetical protein
MKMRFSGALSVLALISAFALAGAAQDTTTQVVKNSDGTYTVIEYPVGKEVTVSLMPSATVTGAKGTARVMRSADGTKVWLDVSGVPADTKTFYAYAVDPSGTPTMLGPVTFSNGTAKAEFATPMNQFMVVLSPNEGLTTIEPTSTVFWSDVPTGYAVVPRRKTADTKAVATGAPTGSIYDVPMLNVPSFGDDTTEVRVNFAGELQGLDGKAYIDNKGGKSTIKMRFSDMRKAPLNKRYVLWAASPDGQYTKLGQVVSTGRQDESEIRGETSLRDFGLMVTVEDIETNTPTSRTFGTFRVHRP